MSKHTPGPWRLSTESPTIIKQDYTHLGLGDNSGVLIGSACGHKNSGFFPSEEESLANALLISAAPDLLNAQTMGSDMNTPDFLDWIADRLVHVYGESPNVDFVLSLRLRAATGAAAIAKATGSA